MILRQFWASVLRPNVFSIVDCDAELGGLKMHLIFSVCVWGKGVVEGSYSFPLICLTFSGYYGVGLYTYLVK